MPNLQIGDSITALDAHEEHVSGKVEKILENTIIIVDKNWNRFLIKKKRF